MDYPTAGSCHVLYGHTTLGLCPRRRLIAGHGAPLDLPPARRARRARFVVPSLGAHHDRCRPEDHGGNEGCGCTPYNFVHSISHHVFSSFFWGYLDLLASGTPVKKRKYKRRSFGVRKKVLRRPFRARRQNRPMATVVISGASFFFCMANKRPKQKGRAPRKKTIILYRPFLASSFVATG
jgi:hypothetical protein